MKQINNSVLIGKKLVRDKGGWCDFPDGTGGIVAMRKVDNLLEIYKVDRIFTVIHPSSIDPERKEPDRKMLIKTLKKGTSNKIVARCFLQLYDLLIILNSQHNKRNEIIIKLKKGRDYLLECENAYLNLRKEQENCVNNIQSNKMGKGNNVITNFPEIPLLNSYCTTFLINAKKFIINNLDIFNIFYKSELNKIDKIIKFLQENYPQNKELISYLTLVQSTIKRIFDFRNRLEHPKCDYMLTINDFELYNTDVKKPNWHISLEKKYEICSDMKALIDVMIVFSEIIFINSLFTFPGNSVFPIRLETIKNEDINKHCPIKYVAYGEVGDNKYVRIGNSLGYEKNLEKYL
ncbi:MAG: hypothetical protein KAU01_06730 [Candidatus Cloacimonetes bacterium]|nr:hypothetical protein [Candidatus Cloacimonadota bacterium]